jgi:hypothetical protein
MFSHLGPIDVDCDAPPYSVVAACEKLGFHSPLDVRWCRMSRFIQRERGRVRGFHPWLWLFGSSQPAQPTCNCGQPLPVMERYSFAFASAKQSHYLLGQCRRCRTIFWGKTRIRANDEHS